MAQALNRRYDLWEGTPDGHPENTNLCIAEVLVVIGGWRWYQCSRKRGHGPDKKFCKQHAKMIEDGRPVYLPRIRLGKPPRTRRSSR